MLHNLSLRVRVFLFFAALAGGTMAALVAGLWLGYHRLNDPALIGPFVQVGVIAGFGITGLIAAVWYLFDVNVAKPIDILSGALRARAHADVPGEFDAAIARYLGDLAPAAQAAAHQLQETRNALAEAVARETMRLQSEKERLEALLSDVPVGVVLCSPDHQLVFYNGQAADQLMTGGAPSGIGLDRRLFDYLREGPVRHAHERLIDSGDPDAASDLLCTTREGARVLAARMRLLAGEGGHEAGAERPGYVLTLRDVTADLAAHTRREALITETLDRIRRPSAALSALAGVLTPGEAAPAALDTALRAEVAALAQAVQEIGQRVEETRAEGWVLASIRATDLVDGLRARLEHAGFAVRTDAAPLLLRCNGFEVIGLMGALAGRVADLAAPAGGFALSLTEDGAEAMLRLSWAGSDAGLSVARLEAWLAAPLDPAVPEVTGRAVLAGHATEIWPERGADGTQSICLPLNALRRAARRPRPIAREVVYDFDLLGKARNAEVADTRLDDLTYVVFDTETTGLLPAQGDEIVQIAAVRIVNGKRVASEVFDTLVNPGRTIPPASTEVHGITDAMVADAPPIAEVGRDFHRFCEGAVLVAHNAPFDMEFLRRHEVEIGKFFDHPIFDTVLLSAVIWGQHEVHSLDALTHRLGITIPEEARHTAIGDTVATADAFLRLLPMLKGKGLRTFGDVLVEVRRHGRLLRDLN